MVYEDALLFGYLARAGGGAPWVKLASDRLNQAIELSAHSLIQAASGGLATAKVNNALFGGLCGLAWTAAHLTRIVEQIAPGDDEIGASPAPSEAGRLNQELDLLLLRCLETGRWAASYGLIDGLVGIGIYFLDRLPAAKASLAAELVLYHLEKMAAVDGNNIRWLPVTGLSHSKQYHLQGSDLGVADGNLGVLYFLSETMCLGIEPEKCKRLMDGCINWLLTSRESGLASISSAYAGSRKLQNSVTRFDGDLGILAVLRQVARRLEREDLNSAAQSLFDYCLTNQDIRSLGDASLCHGAIGAAHIFNRFYQDGGGPRCKEAALAWYRRGIEMRHSTGGIGGYRATPSAFDVRHLELKPGFLDGAIGTALGLLAAITAVEPGWDRLMLLSGKPVL